MPTKKTADTKKPAKRQKLTDSDLKKVAGGMRNNNPNETKQKTNASTKCCW